MADAGKILIMPKGIYDANTSYEVLDLVSHNDIAWLSKKDVKGIEPSEANSEYWFKMVSLQTDADTLDGLHANEVGTSGARNLIPYPYYYKAQTNNGITWTINEDTSVSANGANTASGQNPFALRIRTETGNPLILKAGTYTLSGCPSGGSDQKWSIQIGKTLNGSFSLIGSDYGNGFTFTITEDTQVQVQLIVRTKDTVNLTFKPILELGKIAHDFMPYYFGGAEDALKLNGQGADQYYSLNNATPMVSGDNFNDYTTIGNYTFSQTVATSLVNAPFTDTGGTLKVERSAYDVTSTAFRKQTVIRAQGGTYERHSTNIGVWTEWKKVNDGGNADTVNGFKVYKSLSELGLTEATVTAESIVNAMQNDSMLLHKLGGTATSATLQFPYNYSMLKVTKLSTSYVTFECIGTGNLPIYYAYYNGGSTNKWSGWSTQYLPLTGGTINGKTTINTTQSIPFGIKNANGDINMISFEGASGMLGYIGFNGADNLAYLKGGVGWYSLLHSGNSNKIVFTEDTTTAPASDALWAHL